MMNANSSTSYPPTTTPPPPPSTSPTTIHPSQHHHHSQMHQSSNLSRFPFSSAPPGGVVGPTNVEFSDGSGSGFTIDQQPKKKRGRPRKYSGEGANNIGLGLSPTPVTPSSGGGGDFSGGGDGGGGAMVLFSEPSSKKGRGRPPGSGKKQLDALGATGVGFTPHVITVKAGEDIASKITAFAQQGPRAVCILSANGAICNVTLRQPAMSTGSVTYEGRFEIISLAGSFLPSENYRTGSLSVSLAGSDGRVLGGNVAGMLMAASPTQVIVGSFISDGKKPKTKIPSTPSPNILNFGAPVTDASPPSQGASSDSSDERSDSPLNHGTGPYNNAGPPMQQSMPMYPNMTWPNSTIKTHPN
ncbi:hypothetical protein Leryth_004694 [Lithospermum erythrorhizon]|nr:hypothetical protein Leryth_004694 [Lithospermum erythrorhizon]